MTQWTAKPRPEWVAQVNAEAAGITSLADLVPLDAESLLATATRSTGLTDFGDDGWREPFALFTRCLDEEADLNLMGRLFTREELLIGLRNRLRIEDTYKHHPEIEDEEIVAPLMVIGLPRSGTSILFELLAADHRLKPLLDWEIRAPWPPPTPETETTDPRVDRADHFLKTYIRVAPELQTMHEYAARLPQECPEAFQSLTFVSEGIPTKFNVPTYAAWMNAHADWDYAYAYYKRFLKYLQWRNPNQHWLLKSPVHMFRLPHLFKAFPDVQVIQSHRDPLRSTASAVSLIGTMRWVRSDLPFEAAGYEKVFTPEATSAGLNFVIDQLESGAIPKDQFHSVLYADVVAEPLAALGRLYEQLGIPFTDEARQAIAAYVAAKPKHKFGVHSYDVKTGEEERRERAFYARYQSYFHVPDEG